LSPRNSTNNKLKNEKERKKNLLGPSTKCVFFHLIFHLICVLFGFTAFWFPHFLILRAQGDIDLDTMTIPETNELFQFLRARIYHAFPRLKHIKSEQLISGWDDAEEIRSIAVVRDLVKKKYQFMKNKNGAASQAAEDVQQDYPLGLVPELGLSP